MTCPTSLYYSAGLADARRARVLAGLALVCLLDMSGPLRGQVGWQTSGNSVYVPNGNVGVGTALPEATLDVHVSSSSYTNNIRFGDAYPGYLTSGSSGVYIINYAGTSLLMAQHSGNVGIGTTNPRHLLHVAGTIGAEEVIVSSTGADYVFQPGYRLRPLEEVAAYIRENHHLPEIPPEGEVRDKGLGLGEMQAKLLAKIEELTLHMIQTEERSMLFEQQNRDLQERIVRLENKSHGLRSAQSSNRRDE